MKLTTNLLLALTLVSLLFSAAAAQDSVDVTFRYTRGGGSTVFIPGEFNGWNNAAWPMTYDGTSWIRTARLRVGGNPAPPANGIPGAWQYKFYPGSWINDPLNHHQNPSDNNNSYIITRDPTIYQFVPNQRQSVVNTSTPTISAYIYPKVGAAIDTSTLAVTIDGTTYTGIGDRYDAAAKRLLFVPPVPLANGGHTVILAARSAAGSENRDTVTFTTQAGYVQITSHGGYATLKSYIQLRGLVQNSSASTVRLVRNGADSITVPVSAGIFTTSVVLQEGLNVFRALADSASVIVASDPVSLTYVKNHAPSALITFVDGGNSVELRASSSTDPDSGQAASLLFLWQEDSSNPSVIGGVTGSTQPALSVLKPAAEGEYSFTLIARDADGNADTTRNYFTVGLGQSISFPTIASNPEWAKKGRIYFLFPKAASSAGTLNEAAKLLPHIRDMGFSIVWMMPVMKNASPINQGYGPGYNIVDFSNVAPEYGTNQDFRNFVSDAHTLGLKVILDVTPNHSSRSHPWSLDAHAFHEDSRYWTWYQHTIIPHNDNGLGQSVDADGFNYYSGFSDQLLNLNWSDLDARSEMISIYRSWIKDYDLDGFRFDVYWGPHRRYGEAFMGKPVRDALKHVKPGILLLGEDDGTGTGTETIYADVVNGGVNGGLDAAYDFKLYFNQVRGFGFNGGAVDALNGEIFNGGFFPGPNALFMRFMESQDEDRIVSFYSNNFAIDATTTFHRTMPVASVLFTAPGLPMIWNGQEVGWGYGISGAKENRNRSTINWEYQGKALLTPHYQKLATIRGQFPAFTQHKRDTNGDGSVNSSDSSDFIRVASSNSLVYAFTRPFFDQNGLTVVNVSAAEQTAQINLTGGVKFLSKSLGCYLNNLYENSRVSVLKADLDSLVITLPPYGTGIYTVSATPDSVTLAGTVNSIAEGDERAEEFALSQNYPNPFNPSTSISFVAPSAGWVSLVVYDVLGREIARLVDGNIQAGTNTVVWNGRNSDGFHVGSGVYFYRLLSRGTDAGAPLVRKMLLLR